ncbi:hypothetical protein RHGRI_025973 [Rhododendron griersonianum]|uniref:Uncharacterized protein n=1 Tax=Rhododendron griersonianum TaxID=479676 RepID=A0AAV6IUL6_9ERIC|nr:hypothetical protein RHGRI_025973 [Rhododendron griersonianum]
MVIEAIGYVLPLERSGLMVTANGLVANGNSALGVPLRNVQKSHNVHFLNLADKLFRCGLPAWDFPTDFKFLELDIRAPQGYFSGGPIVIADGLVANGNSGQQGGRLFVWAPRGRDRDYRLFDYLQVVE